MLIRAETCWSYSEQKGISSNVILYLYQSKRNLCKTISEDNLLSSYDTSVSSYDILLPYQYGLGASQRWASGPFFGPVLVLYFSKSTISVTVLYISLNRKSSPQIRKCCSPSGSRSRSWFAPPIPHSLFDCTIKKGRTRFPFNFVIIGLKIFYSNNQNVLQSMNIFSK